MNAVSRRLFLGGAGSMGATAVAGIAGARQLYDSRLSTAGSAADDRSEPVPAMTEMQYRVGVPIQSLPGDGSALHVITLPGNYYLAGGLQGEAGLHGIEIRASHVRIDLRGHSLRGTSGSRSAIVAVPGIRACTVMDGHVLGWGACGIDLMNGRESSVSRISVGMNAGSGIKANGASVVVDCAASSNGDHGIEAVHLTVVERCRSLSNGRAGIRADSNSTVSDCACSDNRAHGICAGSQCRIDHNAISGSPRGIMVGFGCRVEDNLTSANAIGYLATGVGNFLVRNSSQDIEAFTIAAGNAYGPIVHVAGAGSLSGVANADHSWANFSF